MADALSTNRFMERANLEPHSPLVLPPLIAAAQNFYGQSAAAIHVKPSTVVMYLLVVRIWFTDDRFFAYIAKNHFSKLEPKFINKIKKMSEMHTQSKQNVSTVTNHELESLLMYYMKTNSSTAFCLSMCFYRPPHSAVHCQNGWSSIQSMGGCPSTMIGVAHTYCSKSKHCATSECRINGKNITQQTLSILISRGRLFNQANANRISTDYQAHNY